MGMLLQFPTSLRCALECAFWALPQLAVKSSFDATLKQNKKTLSLNISVCDL